MNADEPELGGFLPDLFRVGVLLKQFFDDVLLKLSFDEFPDRLLYFLLFLTQFEIHLFLRNVCSLYDLFCLSEFPLTHTISMAQTMGTPPLPHSVAIYRPLRGK
jgi:hypothetical protein